MNTCLFVSFWSYWQVHWQSLLTISCVRGINQYYQQNEKNITLNTLDMRDEQNNIYIDIVLHWFWAGWWCDWRRCLWRWLCVLKGENRIRPRYHRLCFGLFFWFFCFWDTSLLPPPPLPFVFSCFQGVVFEYGVWDCLLVRKFSGKWCMHIFLFIF